MLLSPQGFLSVSGRVAGAATQAQTFTNGVTLDDIFAASGPVDIHQDGTGLRIVDTGNSDNAVVTVADATGLGGYMTMKNDAGSSTMTIRSYASSGVQAYFTAGNVGIGTSAPDTQLHIRGASSGILAKVENTVAATTNYTGLQLKTDTAQWSLYQGSSTHSSIPNKIGLHGNTGTINGYAMVFDASGGVVFPGGAALYGPAYDFQLYRGDSDSVYLSITNATTGSGTSNGLVIGINSSEEAIIYNAEATHMRFGTTNTARMTLSSTGNLSIGNFTPSYKLEVDGEISFRERSSDPSDPAEGAAVLWMSNGTGSGDDGDVMIKITAGAATKTITLVDFSAF